MQTKEYRQQYYLANQDRLKEYAEEYRRTHKKQIARTISQWKQKNQRRYTMRERERQLSIKLDVLSHYGPHGVLQCTWPGCEVTDIDMLSLDHVNNDGAEHRRNLFGKKQGNSGGLYGWVRSHEYPPEFQTLCMNHQWKKENLRRRKEYEDRYAKF
jgi:hypothetical protein